MEIMKSVSVKDNELYISKVKCSDLCKKYKTPLYVMDEEVIRDNCRVYKNAIDKYYNGNGKVLFASKAMSAKFIYKIVSECGLGADVVSGGELYTAKQAGMNMNDICFHGNNKTNDELEMALDLNVGRIVVDNTEELVRLDKLAGEKNKTANIMFRIKPGIDAHTHQFIMTGQIDSKFGVALENNEAFEIMKKAKELKNINVTGVHCHIGSQIFDVEPFELAASLLIEFIAKVNNEFDMNLHELNLGGGFGIKYTENDDPVEYDEYIKFVSECIKRVCKKYSIEMPFIYMEPGRSITANAGMTLYTVGSVKEIKGVRNYVAIDGGMFDNPRYALYKAKYKFIIANKAAQKADYEATIAGKCCETGDLLQENTLIQKPAAGDILAALATGAYNFSMASNYNRNLRPPVVLVNGSEDKLVVRRQTYEDIVSCDL